MSANFLFLPTALFTNIWDFCGPNEIIAVASTCRMFKALVDSSMLQVNAKRSKDEKIPIFFADLCHSVFCQVHLVVRHEQDYGFVVFSRKRHQNGDFDTLVWEETKRSCHYYQSLTFDISFRNDPAHEYILRSQCDQQTIDYTVSLRKQFMSRSLTATMKGALNTCLWMGRHTHFFWSPARDDWIMEEFFETRCFMKLFVLGYRYLSNASSPVGRFFESGPTSTMPVYHQLVQQQILNLFEQALEQKEPLDCAKFPQPLDDMLPSMERTYPRYDWDRLPDFILNKNFAYERCLKEDDDFVSNDELVFIARIPLVPKTIDVTLRLYHRNVFPKSLFVLFFKKREGGMDAQVMFDHYSRLSHTRVMPVHEACFLYWVPGNATRFQVEYITVSLEFALGGHTRYLRDWMKLLLDRFYTFKPLTEQRYLPIALLRAGAVALLGPDHEQKSELKDAFEVEGLDLTRKGLECMIDVCNVILQD